MKDFWYQCFLYISNSAVLFFSHFCDLNYGYNIDIDILNYMKMMTKKWLYNLYLNNAIIKLVLCGSKVYFATYNEKLFGLLPNNFWKYIAFERLLELKGFIKKS